MRMKTVERARGFGSSRRHVIVDRGGDSGRAVTHKQDRSASDGAAFLCGGYLCSRARGKIAGAGALYGARRPGERFIADVGSS